MGEYSQGASVSGRGRVYPPLAVRFAACIDKTPGFGPRGDCWRWTGTVIWSGYGQICRPKAGPQRGRREYAHRIAYELHHDVSLGIARKEGPLVLHECDNPTCVNPAHLFLGTDLDNTRDMDAKGRRVVADQKGTANPLHRLTDDAVRAIRRDRRPLQAIADDYGVAISTVCQARNGTTWQHVTASPYNEGIFA